MRVIKKIAAYAEQQLFQRCPSRSVSRFVAARIFAAPQVDFIGFEPKDHLIRLRVVQAATDRHLDKGRIIAQPVENPFLFMELLLHFHQLASALRLSQQQLFILAPGLQKKHPCGGCQAEKEQNI